MQGAHLFMAIDATVRVIKGELHPAGVLCHPLLLALESHSILIRTHVVATQPVY